ncbi:MAG: EAL domain-containing protein [Sulfitobacter sp.]
MAVTEENFGNPSDHLRSYQHLLEHMPHPVALLSVDGTIEHFNEKFTTELDTKLKVARHTRFDALLLAADRRVFSKFLAANDLGSEENQTYETVIPVADGERRVIQVIPLRHAGQLVGFISQIVPAPMVHDPVLRHMVNETSLGIWDYDVREQTLTVSIAWCQMRGIKGKTQLNISQDTWLKRVHKDTRADIKAALMGKGWKVGQRILVQYRVRHKKGHWMWILCRGSVTEVDKAGRPLRAIGADTDISDVKRKEEELRELSGKMQLAVEASGMGIWEFDTEREKAHWDERLLEMYGITDGETIRSKDNWATYIHPDDVERTVAHSDECTRKNIDLKCDFRIVLPSGKIRYIRTMARNVQRSSGHSALIGVNFDVTDDYLRAEELELARSKLEYDSRHDALTGLGNRRKLDETMFVLFNNIAKDQEYVAMHIDLDHFKRVNDSLGHSAGDHVLSSVAQKLSAIIGDTGGVFRVGGDEFAVLFETRPSDEALVELCEKLIKKLSEPATWQEQDCTIGASIGYAVGKGPPGTPSEVFINADTALYSAKHAGRGGYKAYSEALEVEVSEVGNVRQSLIDALENNEIICYYQAQFDAKTLDVVGAEALVRWQCPNRGLLGPDKFLPQAIEAGLLPEIDARVFRHILDQQTEWAAMGISYPRISVNISHERLNDAELVPKTRAVIEPHHSISFELLETAFLDRPDTLLAFKLDSLREMGILIELDDFGSGHSSIAALQAIEPDKVKIDQSLVAPLSSKPEQLMMLKSLVKIARLQSAGIVVEGVETAFHLAAIRDLDCDVLQGYALQRPMSALEFGAFLDRGRKVAVV